MKWYILTKTVCFGTKQYHFDQHRKKKMSNVLSFDYYLSSSRFCTRKVARIATFSEHSMLHISTKSDKSYITMVA